jgi:hypothetical protein
MTLVNTVPALREQKCARSKTAKTLGLVALCLLVPPYDFFLVRTISNSYFEKTITSSKNYIFNEQLFLGHHFLQCQEPALPRSGMCTLNVQSVRSNIHSLQKITCRYVLTARAPVHISFATYGVALFGSLNTIGGMWYVWFQVFVRNA